MNLQNQIVKYYNDIADKYDLDRFGNSYGMFIDRRERDILDRLSIGKSGKTLEIACGTGRLLNYADVGVDASASMLDVAASKFPRKKLINAMAQKIPLPDVCFNCIFSFHLMMHLSTDSIRDILNEAKRLLVSGGRFVFDIPSSKRRNIFGKRTGGWHGNTSLSIDEIKELCGENFSIKSRHGILFIPIHRIPKCIRSFFVNIDKFLCSGSLKEYSSYVVYELEKK